MPSGVVLVIEDDEWVSRLLANAIRGAGYEVLVCATAAAGLAAACQSEPECIICDIDLPDEDGYWVARKVRTQASRVSVTPFLFLSGYDDPESRLEGFHVGADVYMTKPFRVDEVVAQIGALVQMASRLRQRRDSLMSLPDGAAQTAIEGDLSQMSIATVLTVLEMERRSGIFEVVSKKRRAQLDIAEGCLVHGAIGGTPASALAAVRTVLSWKVGRFWFTPASRDLPAARRSIASFLLEATRLDDESARNDPELPQARRVPQLVLTATSLGGPAAGLEDVAPPSSRMRAEKRSSPGAMQRSERESEPPVSFDLSIELESLPPSKPTPTSGGNSDAVGKGSAALRPPKLPQRPPLPPPPPITGKNDVPQTGVTDRGKQVTKAAGVKPKAVELAVATGTPPRQLAIRPPRPEPQKKR